jgi:hypothetical protein
MKPNWYFIICRAIEDGLKLGWNRAHKHVDNPESETILEHQNNAIFELLSEIVIWDSTDQ